MNTLQHRSRTFFVVSLLTALLGLASTASWAEMSHGVSAVKQAPQNLDRIVAIINKEIITEQDLNQRTDITKKEMIESQMKIPSDKELRRQVLSHLIDEKLELQIAKRVGVTVADADVDEAILKMSRQNNQSHDELRRSVEAEGLTFDQFREHVRKQLIITHLLERDVASHITISKNMVDNVLNSPQYQLQRIEEYKVADILVEMSAEPSSQEVQRAKARADRLHKKLLAGANFRQLAVAESDGQQALEGGDLGWRRPAELPDVFNKALKTMLTGDISGPIRAPNGFHIIKLVDMRDGDGHHYVTENQIRHILLKTSALISDKQVKQSLLKIRDQAVHGADFGELAKQYSQDIGTAPKGGNLGWVGPNLLTTPFQVAVEKLKPGEVSQPVKTQFGWHLIQVTGHRQKDDTKAFQADQVRKMIYRRSFEQNTQAWLHQARQVSHIEILLDDQ